MTVLRINFSAFRQSEVPCSLRKRFMCALQFKLCRDKGVEWSGRFGQLDQDDYTPINDLLSQTTCNLGFISWKANICHGSCQPWYRTHNLGNIKTCTETPQYECTIVLKRRYLMCQRMQIKLRGHFLDSASPSSQRECTMKNKTVKYPYIMINNLFSRCERSKSVSHNKIPIKIQYSTVLNYSRLQSHLAKHWQLFAL